MLKFLYTMLCSIPFMIVLHTMIPSERSTPITSFCVGAVSAMAAIMIMKYI